MFETWADRVATVNEPESQRALVAEIAVWRARRLTDVPATRQGTWALARLHQQLGETDKAVREARQLVSLCQTPPLASKEQVTEARRLLQGLGVKAPKMPRLERGNATRGKKPRDSRPDAGRGDDSLASARKAAAQGHTRKVRKLVGDRKGAVWTALRSWSALTDGLAADEAALRGAVEQVIADLAGLAGVRGPAPAQQKAAAETTEGPLVELLGRPVPTKRRAALSVADAFLAEHPERLDELADRMLEHHVAGSGPTASAGWLSGLVARALVAGGAATKARLAALQGEGATGIALFDAWAFHRAVRLGAAGVEGGWTVDGLREGVLSRGEPADRRVWTLRISDAAGQRMLAIAPHATEPWPGSLATDLASRIAQLAPAAVVLASGVGNAALREAAEAAGLVALDEDADDAALLAQLGGQGVIPARPKRAPKENAPTTAPKETGPTPPQQLAELLGADEVDEAALTSVIGLFRRPSSALRVAERAEAPLALAPLPLQAVHAASDDDRVLPEGTTLALRAAAAGVDGVRELLTDGPTAGRYGGPGVGDVADLAAVLVADGWELFRVLRGTTRREKEKQPVLETLGEALDGLWRMLVRKGDVKGEVWFLGSLSPEGRAGVPQLLLEEHQRAIVLPVDPDLLSWYGELDGPEAIGWTGEEADALRGAVAGWSA